MSPSVLKASLLASVLAIGAALSITVPTAPKADERQTFVIAGSEGYGVSDCLVDGSACGRVVADAWCESHGHARALAYGRAEDVTGSIELVKAARATTPGAVVIRCAE